MYNPGKKKKKKSFGKKVLGFLLKLMVLCLLLAVAAGYLIKKDIDGKGSAGEELIVNVPNGASTARIASVLKENGLIRFEKAFRVYSRFKGYDGTYQQGDHKLLVGSGYEALINELQKTTYEEVETFTVTFAEGYTCLKMAIILEDMGICTKEEFVRECNEGVFQGSFLDQISESPDKFVKLEGFLFPDTYEFEIGISLHDIIQEMLSNFEKKVYTPEMKQMVEKSGLSLEENIILASIVEKETLGDEMYSMVAGVFKNRLNDSRFPHLESDTSAQHIEGNFIYGVLGYYYNGNAQGYIKNIPYSMVEAYDTYICNGLPVGAICNPGIKAISGTLEPDSHGYFFFITDCDNNYYWGVTAKDHDSNIAKVREYNRTHS